jgi:hypothetical protein
MTHEMVEVSHVHHQTITADWTRFRDVPCAASSVRLREDPDELALLVHRLCRVGSTRASSQALLRALCGAIKQNEVGSGVFAQRTIALTAPGLQVYADIRRERQILLASSPFYASDIFGKV